MVRTNTTKFETRSNQVCEDFERGLAYDNVEEAAELIANGGAALKISVYPWGAEFDVVREGAASKREEEGPDAVV